MNHRPTTANLIDRVVLAAHVRAAINAAGVPGEETALTDAAVEAILESSIPALNVAEIMVPMALLSKRFAYAAAIFRVIARRAEQSAALAMHMQAELENPGMLVASRKEEGHA